MDLKIITEHKLLYPKSSDPSLHAFLDWAERIIKEAEGTPKNGWEGVYETARRDVGLAQRLHQNDDAHDLASHVTALLSRINELEAIIAFQNQRQSADPPKCPYCGSKELETIDGLGYEAEENYLASYCNVCQAQGPWASDPGDAMREFLNPSRPADPGRLHSSSPSRLAGPTSRPGSPQASPFSTSGTSATASTHTPSSISTRAP